jgi:pyruvate dehydrogenase E1 component
VFYYVTVMNENYAHPAMPEGAEEGIRRGMYKLRPAAKEPGKRKVRLLGSGTILREALAAAEILEREHGVAAEVWSVTSYTELRRDGLTCDAWNAAQPTAHSGPDSNPHSAPPRDLHGDNRKSWAETCLGDDDSPVIAVSDYMRAVPDLIRAWVPAKYSVLGTDGFGRSDTRAALRQHFGVSAQHVVEAALRA